MIDIEQILRKIKTAKTTQDVVNIMRETDSQAQNTAKEFADKLRKQIVQELKAKFEELNFQEIVDEVLQDLQSNFAKVNNKINADIERIVRNALSAQLDTNAIRELLRSVLIITDRQRTTIARTARISANRTAQIKVFEKGNVQFVKYVGVPTVRRFCAQHLNKTYSLLVAKNMLNDFRQNALTYCGGWNCRHRWIAVSNQEAKEEAQKKEEAKSVDQPLQDTKKTPKTLREIMEFDEKYAVDRKNDVLDSLSFVDRVLSVKEAFKLNMYEFEKRAYGEYDPYVDLRKKTVGNTKKLGMNYKSIIADFKFSEAKYTLFHEIGHYLDNLIHEIQTGEKYAFASNESKSYESGKVKDRIENLFNAITESKQPDRIRERYKLGVLPKKFYTYYLQKHELFARAFAQYIEEKNGLKSEKHESNIKLGLQWEKEDFKKISNAFDKLFEELQWLKE